MSAERVCFKILLIDDDPDFLRITKTVLESRSAYKVVTACNGFSGLSTAKVEKPNLIITDIVMPFENGFTVVEELKIDDELNNIPVLILTGFPYRIGETDIPINQGMTTEADDYIEKPVEPEELLRRVDKLLKTN